MSKKPGVVIFKGKQEINSNLCRRETELFIHLELGPALLKYSRKICKEIILPFGNTFVI
jgi:hypothetical protein